MFVAACAALVLGTSRPALAISAGCSAVNSGQWSFGAGPGATASRTGNFAVGDRVFFTFSSSGLGGTVSSSGTLSVLVGGVIGPGPISFGAIIMTAGSGTLTLTGIATNGFASPIIVSMASCQPAGVTVSPGCSALNSGQWLFGAAPGATSSRTATFAAGDRVFFTFSSSGLGGTVSGSGTLSVLVGGVLGPGPITFGAVIATPGSGTLTLLGIATNGFASPIVVSAASCQPTTPLGSPLTSTTHDLDGDGKSDIAWRDTDGNAAIWLMNGTQISQASIIGSVSTSWQIAGQRDFNGDGKSDLLWRDTSGNVAIWLMNGTQISQATIVGAISNSWQIAGTGDFNGDGKSDILWRDTSGNVAIWLMNGTQISQAAIIGSISTSWQIAGTGDFDGDGKSDILWRDTSGNVAMWQMNGVQIAQAAILGSISTSWQVVGTGDFNGDGKSDVVWSDTNGNVAIWLMNGPQIAQASIIGAVSTLWQIVGTGDFNGDGKSDLLWRDTSGNVAMWQMNGAQISQAAILGAISTAWTIQNNNAD